MAGTRIHVRELLPDFPMYWDPSEKQGCKAYAAATAADIALAVAITRALECFNHGIFAIAAVLAFPSSFFPHEQWVKGMLYALLIFSLAFVARPLGATAFLAAGRRFGRQVGLIGASLLCGVSTVGIALLPGYASLGFAAIVWLAFLRIVQGMAVSESLDSLSERLVVDVQGKRGNWHGMASGLGVFIGLVLASVLFACLSFSVAGKEFLDWGWRYPFT